MASSITTTGCTTSSSRPPSEADEHQHNPVESGLRKPGDSQSQTSHSSVECQGGNKYRGRRPLGYAPLLEADWRTPDTAFTRSGSGRATRFSHERAAAFPI